MQQQSTNDADTAATVDDCEATRAKKEDQMKRGRWVCKRNFTRRMRRTYAATILCFMSIWLQKSPTHPLWHQYTSMTLDASCKWQRV